MVAKCENKLLFVTFVTQLHFIIHSCILNLYCSVLCYLPLEVFTLLAFLFIHGYIHSYLFDVHNQRRFDKEGFEHSANHQKHIILWNGCFHSELVFKQYSLLLHYGILEKLVTFNIQILQGSLVACNIIMNLKCLATYLKTQFTLSNSSLISPSFQGDHTIFCKGISLKQTPHIKN